MYCYYYNEDSRMLLLNVLSSLNFIFVASTCSSAGSNILNTEKCDCRSNTCLSLSVSLSLINLANMSGFSSVFCDVYKNYQI